MKEKKKGEDREAKKQEFMVKKLKRSVLVGKKGGFCTPPPTWRLEESTAEEIDSNNNYFKLSTEFLYFPNPQTVSARKLCANLWEIESHKTPFSEMSKASARIHHRHHKNNGFQLPSHEQLDTAISLSRNSLDSPIQQNLSVERKDHTRHSVSPPSYGSSLEVAPYKPVVRPSRSSDLKGRTGESSYSLKTSTELLKVLNRIWSLEEQHASNMSLVKTMKMELDQSRARIKELLQQKHLDRQEIDGLKKQIAEYKLVRKKTEHDRIKVAVQSIHSELQDEKKLRKRSESLQRKLAQEFSELKSSFCIAVRELKREKKARILLENLCDEFAKGIRDYEKEVRSLKHKPAKDWSGIESPDRLILHVSEAWLDERMQMELTDARNDIFDKNTILDKLGLDIETFLQAKQAVELRKGGNLSPKDSNEHCFRRYSLESFPLNDAVSAPQNAAGEHFSESDSDILEVSKRTYEKQSKSSDKQQGSGVSVCHQKGINKSNSIRKEVGSQETVKGCSLTCLPVEAERENLEHEVPDKYSHCCQATHEDIQERHSKRVGNHGLKSKDVLDNLIINESECREESCMQSVLTGNVSPAQQWKSKLTPSNFEKSQPSLKWPQDLDENTLMAKLLEARLEAKKHSRSKISKGSL